MPVLPPEWASLPGDALLYDRPPPLRESPGIIRIDADARCVCGSRVVIGQPIVTSPCTIYNVLGSLEVMVELQPCHACLASSRRHVGPDSRSHGLFNYNNRIMFTHDLLDEYTMAFTSSETPFVAWVGVVARRYARHQSPRPFVREDVFRSAWFGYGGLLALDNDMTCPKCSGAPEDIIFDGVTLAFGKKHMLDTLRPPTETHTDSPVRTSRYVKGQPLLPDAKLRKLLRDIVKGEPRVDAPMGGVDDDDDDDDEETSGPQPHPNDGERAQLENLRREHARLEHLQIISEVTTKLLLVDDALGKLFSESFGLLALGKGLKTPRVYEKLFKQVQLNWY